MNIADICTREVVMADRAASLQQAANLMREHHVGTLVVVGPSAEGQQAVGIVTDRDMVVEAMARGLDVAHTEIGRLAQGKLASVPASATLDDAIATMKKFGVRRLLVSGDSGQLYGIASLDDLLGALVHEMSDLANAARSGIEREAVQRPPLAPVQSRPVRVPEHSFE